MKIKEIHKYLMHLGKYTGCHQMSNRSFIIGIYQFPICARCTGVLFGNIFAVIFAFIFIPYWKWLILGCFIIFVDWLIQFLGIKESNNIRRLITGIIGGYSLNSVLITVICFIFKILLY